MSQQRVLKFKPFITIAILILVMLYSPLGEINAGEGWRLWLDDKDMGVIPIIQEGKLVLVSIGTMARILDFDLYPKDESLIIKNGTDRVQIVQDAAAVWFNVQLIPLASAARFERDQWWVDSRSAIKILSYLVNSRGESHNVTWGGSGKIEQVGDEQKDGSHSRLQADRNIPDSRTLLPSPQEKVKTLSELGSIRWGKHDDRVRVVLDLKGSQAPEPVKKPGMVEVSFALSSTMNSAMVDSPYPQYVRTGITNFGTLFTLSFHHNASQVSHFVLENPLRLVIDFSKGAAISPVEREKVQPNTPVITDLPRPDIPLPATPEGGKLVVVDPGHGGKDPGAVANGVIEKDINLRISRFLVEELKKRGIPARLTREDDRYLRLQERTELANKWDASVFISIHANALPPGRHATGMEIYLMALPTDKDAMQLALIENKELGNGNGNGSVAEASDKKTRMLLNILGNMQQNAKIDESTTVAEVLFRNGQKRGLSMRRVAQAPFFVLRGAGMPAILVETGFITEKREARLLAAPSYQGKLAASLAEGIAVYLQQI
ncbi:MAG: N-acetylmuramoyl-L-alanine amidase [Synergistales bacterium]|nr:N-acetylmuramoyl-L-alanine amidase [Synergistales bacterium]